MFLCSGYSIAQGEKDKVEAIRVNFISEQLKLTTNESEKFWPVFNSFDVKFQDLRQRRHYGIYQKSFSVIESMNDEEANNLIDEYLSIETDEPALQKQKIAALRKVISPNKIITPIKA